MTTLHDSASPHAVAAPHVSNTAAASHVPTPLSAPADGARAATAHAAAPYGDLRAAWALVRRDLRIAARRWAEIGLPIVFFVASASLFPFGVGAEVAVLRQIAPGVIWVCVLLSVLLSMTTFHAGDHADGTLEQLLLSGRSPALLAAARSLSHWLMTGLPLVLVSPVLGLMFGLEPALLPVLMLGLLLGTPTLSLLGNLGAALVVGLRSGGMLLFLLVLPLMIPVLIFGAGAVVAVQSGLDAQGHLSLLAALLIASGLLLPWAIGQALTIAIE
jgi:heme exporter protein B